MKTTRNPYSGIISYQAENAEERALFNRLTRSKQNKGYTGRPGTYPRKKQETNNRAYTKGRGTVVQVEEKFARVAVNSVNFGKATILQSMNPRQYNRIVHTQHHLNK